MDLQAILLEGLRCHQSGRLAEAERHYRLVLDQDPRHGDALNFMGVLAYQGGRPEIAVDLYRQSIASNSHNASAHLNLGVALGQLNRIEDAIAAVTRALALDPNSADAHFNLGTLLGSQGRHGEAADQFKAALALKPDHVEALENFGQALSQSGHPHDARDAFAKAIALNPKKWSAHVNLAATLRRLGHLDDAIRTYGNAIALRPDHAPTYLDLGNTLRDAGKAQLAVDAYRRAVAIDPSSALAHGNLGATLAETGQLDEALAACRQAVSLSPGNAQSRYNLGMLSLLRGDFETGWADYEYRLQHPDLVNQTHTYASVPPWRGEPAEGRTILLWPEQGLGDIIQFVRYVPLVRGLGWTVILEVPAHLLRLVASMDNLGDVTLVPLGHPVPAHDRQASLLSLPGVFATKIETIPNAVPYLAADPDRVSMWNSRLPRHGLRVGLNWQGNPNAVIDRGRSFPLTAIAPLASIPDVTFISLQKHHGISQINQLSGDIKVMDLGDGFDSGPDAFIDSAAVMMNLDVIITCDTSIAHLAGALGRPTWVALKAVPDWRWMTNREDSPWYPQMRLFRQSKHGDWEDVFARMAAALAKFGNEPHHPI